MSFHFNPAMNIALSSTIDLCENFEQNWFSKYIISLKNLKECFEPRNCCEYCNVNHNQLMCKQNLRKKICSIEEGKKPILKFEPDVQKLNDVK